VLSTQLITRSFKVKVHAFATLKEVFFFLTSRIHDIKFVSRSYIVKNKVSYSLDEKSYTTLIISQKKKEISFPPSSHGNRTSHKFFFQVYVVGVIRSDHCENRKQRKIEIGRDLNQGN